MNEFDRGSREVAAAADAPAAGVGLAHVERLVDAIDLPISRWDARFRLTFCNPRYALWAGRARENLLGRSVAEIFGDKAWRVACDAFNQALSGDTVSFDRLVDHLAGPPRWVRIQVLPERDAQGCIDAVWGIAFDVHDDIELREQLQAAQRRLDRFTENIPYPLTYVDRDYVLRFVNRAYLHATGMTREQLLGRPIGDVRGVRRWTEHRPFFDRALGGEACEYTRLTDLAHLGPRWVRTTYTPDLDDHGQVVGIYTTTIDVHELTLAQLALRRSLDRDALTDVLSRRAVMGALEVALGHSSVEPVALFFVDLDDFKQINDTHGHRAGDAALVAVARALQSAVRAKDDVGRFGGDEFLVLARLPDRGSAQALAGHLRDAVRATGSSEMAVTASITRTGVLLIARPPRPRHRSRVVPRA